MHMLLQLPQLLLSEVVSTHISLQTTMPQLSQVPPLHQPLQHWALKPQPPPRSVHPPPPSSAPPSPPVHVPLTQDCVSTLQALKQAPQWARLSERTMQSSPQMVSPQERHSLSVHQPEQHSALALHWLWSSRQAPPPLPSPEPPEPEPPEPEPAPAPDPEPDPD